MGVEASYDAFRQLAECHDIVDPAGGSKTPSSQVRKHFSCRDARRINFVNFFLTIFSHEVRLQIKRHPMLSKLQLGWAHWTHHVYEFCNMVERQLTAGMCSSYLGMVLRRKGGY